MIVSSNFTHNKGAKSVLYFDRSSRSAKSCEYLYLQNSNFSYNKVPIHLSNQNLYIIVATLNLLEMLQTMEEGFISVIIQMLLLQKCYNQVYT